MWVEIITSDFDSLCLGESAFRGAFPLFILLFLLLLTLFTAASFDT